MAVYCIGSLQSFLGSCGHAICRSTAQPLGAANVAYNADSVTAVLTPFAVARRIFATALFVDVEARFSWRWRGSRRGLGGRGRGRGRRRARAWLDSRAGPFGIGRSGGDLLLDAAFVGPALDAEVAVLAPMRVPAVSDFPVIRAVFNAPTDDADGVAARNASGHVVVNSGRVVLEITVDCESRLDGPSGQDSLLNRLGAVESGSGTRKGEGVGREFIMRRLGAAVAFCGALRGLFDRRAARRAFTWVWVAAHGPMVVTVRERKC